MQGWFDFASLGALIRAAVILGVGYLLARFVSRALVRILTNRTAAQQLMVARQICFYLIFGLAAVSAMRELGFSFSVLLGAAGVLTVAVGFASQTSASNLISGLFLIGERPFVVGETIKVGDISGEVIAIDLLSAKLKTPDNLFVRVPNETLIKTPIVNMSRFPIRRYDLQLSVAYKEDIGQVRALLEDVARHNPLCLVEPKPLIIFQGFGDSALNLQFSVWARKESYLDLRNSVAEQVKVAFDAAGIEIPFPHRTLYAGSQSAPFPVQIVPAAGTNTAPAD